MRACHCCGGGSWQGDPCTCAMQFVPARLHEADEPSVMKLDASGFMFIIMPHPEPQYISISHWGMFPCA